MVSQPIAYFLTWTCKGARLHGDSGGTVDRRHNRFGQDPLPADASRRLVAERLMNQDPVILVQTSRELLDRAFREVAATRGWKLIALAVRSNHVHAVVAAPGQTPERVMNDLKAWGTRRLRDAAVIGKDAQPWTRHGSTIYVWKETELAEIVRYVDEGQDVPH